MTIWILRAWKYHFYSNEKFLAGERAFGHEPTDEERALFETLYPSGDIEEDEIEFVP
jgi:hypothetical protein